MTGGALQLLLGGGLFAAFALGWAAHWLWARTARRRGREAAHIARLSHDLLLTQQALEALEAEAREAEAALRDQLEGREAELSAEMDAAAAALREREAELEAAMEGLGAARRELAAMRGEQG